MINKINLDELYVLVKEFYGNKVKMLYQNSEKREIACILYNAFEVHFSLDERTNCFGAGIVIGEGKISHEVLPNEKISLNSDRNSITNSLQIIDKYCKLRLPDKFLKYHGW